jgi:hypothetical protein
MTARGFLVLCVLLASNASAQERGPFAELVGLGDDARAAWPELAALVDDAQELAAAGGNLDPRAMREAHYGGGASTREARADRLALGQALEALVSLELAAAKRDDVDAANRHRSEHDTLRTWINAGIAARHKGQPKPRGPAPELKSALEAGRGYVALLTATTRPGRASIAGTTSRRTTRT